MIEKHYINIAELSKVLDWMVHQYWYIQIHNDTNLDRQDWGNDQSKLADSLITTLTPDGKINEGFIHGKTPIKDPYHKSLGVIKGVWRMPFGWDNESTKQRAPLVWEVFDKVNKLFFNDEFTLDGHGEGIRATRQMWQDPKNHDLPGWGKFLARGNSPSIWTSYANGRPNGMHCHGNLPEQKSGAHMDSDGNPDNWDGYYTILINLNPIWRPNSGGEVIFHELGSDKNHFRRGYGIGYAKEIVAHEPGLVMCYPSNYIHRTIPNVVANEEERFQQKLAFRVRKKA
jgi:hypothetical protein